MARQSEFFARMEHEAKRAPTEADASQGDESHAGSRN
jgi:hypothetical protein